MPNKTTLITGAAAVVTAGSLAFAGSTLAQADTPDESGTGTSGSSATEGGQDGGRGARGGHEHTEVTGDEATKVTDAVTAKDSAVTVESVRKDPDGSYDVMGTKDGERVMVEVSADLATIEVRTGGPGRGGGRGGHEHTEVTGDEATKVGDAVKAEDSAVTVEKVLKDADGSYDVLGTKAGERVRVDVSADLATIEVRTGGQGREGRRGSRDSSARGGSGTPAPSTTPSTGTSPTDIPTTPAT